MSEPSARVPDLSSEQKRALLTQLLRNQARHAVSELSLSYGQQALWLTHQLAPQSWAYNVLFAARVESEVQTTALHGAFQAILARHAILRTTYTTRHGKPEQQIHEHPSVSFEVIDAATWSDEAFHDRLIETARQPFDLEHGPMLRVGLFTRATTDHVLLLVVHHIAIDAFSLGILLEELRGLYTAAKAGIQALLPALDLQYTDYARWQAEMLAGPEGERLWAYWQQQLAGELPMLSLPTDRPRPPVQTDHGASHSFICNEVLTHQLKTLARTEGATLYMTLLAAFYVLLYRYTGQEDLLVGTFNADRVRPEFRRIVGYFVNPLVLRTNLAGNPPFRTFLGQVRHTVLEALKHQEFPFALLVERLQPAREASRSPLFQVAFVLQQLQRQEDLLQCFLPGITGVQIDFGELRLSPFPLPQQEGQFDLALEMAEVGEKLWGNLKYNTDLFDATTMARLAEHLQTLLAGIVAQPEQPLTALPLLTEVERQQIVVAWNNTQTAYPVERCLHQWIEAQVDRTPDAIAVVCEDVQLTYHELNQRANHLAHHLRSLGVGPDVLVGLCVERSLEMVIGLLGILKAGAAYVPFDPAYPPERLAFMLEDTRVPVLLTQERLLSRLPTPGARVLCLDADWASIATESVENPIHYATPANLAYVIYTSGSTGRPKGVMISHGSICNRLLWMQDTYQLTAVDRVLQKTPFSFDVSVWEFFWPLMTGARLVMARPGGHQDSAYLAELIQAQQITTLHFVPSMLQVFLEEQGLEACQSLRQVICSGEALRLALQERFFTRLDATLHNLYGPTEAAVDVTFWTCQRESQRHTVPIGYPIANTQMYVLDAHLQPVPLGVAGELHIGGVALARGYRQRPELTAEKFIPHPWCNASGARLYKTGDLARYLSDGSLEFLGRLDYQVKVRGFRIELGEIEAVLRQHAAVREAVVMAREDVPGDKCLVAYVVPHQEPAPAGSHWRRFLEEKLPPSMLPAAFVLLDAMPLTPNGKINRRALPALERTRPELDSPLVAPRTPVEEALATIWMRVLGIERVGIYDNFFELGGDSIRCIQVRAQARSVGLDVPLHQLFHCQTIHELGRDLSTPIPDLMPAPKAGAFSLLSAADRQRLPEAIEDAYPLAALQAGMLFHSQWQIDSATYHDVFSYHLKLPWVLPALQNTVQQLVARHAVLRTSFDLTSYSEPLQLVHQQVLVPVQGEDLRSYPPAEQEQVLAVWRAAEKRRDFDWNMPPLLRLFVHQRSDISWQLTLSFHHAILDGWSVASLLTEFLSLYLVSLSVEPEVVAAPLAACYGDFVALERATLQSQQAEQYWQHALADCTIAMLPAWAGSDVAAGEQETAVVSVPIPTEVSNGLHRLARSASVPLKSVLLAAHLRVMSLLSGHTDVLTGVVLNGRPEEQDGERILGLFLNTVPFRCRLPGGTWSDLVRHTFDAERALFPFRRYPMSELQRQHGGRPLFDVAFDYTHFHVYHQLTSRGALEVLQTEIFEQTNFPLYVRFSQDVAGTQLSLALHYDTTRLGAEQMRTIRDYYATTLTEMVSAPSKPYMSVCLLSASERQRILYEWNHTTTAYPKDMCIHQFFEIQVERTPDAVAVVCANDHLTYRELNQRANQLAHHLQTLGVGPEILVGLCVERSVEMVVGLLGILKAGGAYVPLDPTYPQERLTFMLEDARVTVLVTQQRLIAELPALAATVVCLDADWSRMAQQSAANPACETTPENLAYVMYTSGSTGRPKGVLGLHGGAVNRFAWMWETYPFATDEACCQKTSLNFVDSVWELFGPLLQGIKVVIVSNDVLQEPPRLVQALADENVTRLVLVPSLLAAMLDSTVELQHRLPQLRMWITSGELLSAELCQRFRRCMPHSVLLNLYGSSEVAADVTWYDTRALRGDGSHIPIGRPLANTQMYLLDAHLQPVPIGVLGELYAGGAGLARGYLNHSELTAERFMANPFGDTPGTRLYKTGDLARYLPDGNLEFLGRRDHQVKVRGYRIEMGEIEAVLRQHPAVRETVVVARHDTPGTTRLVAYLVTDQAHPPAVRDLRGFLRQHLPEYMLPATFVWCEGLPLTPNGKVDRLALLASDPAAPTSERVFVAPRTPGEKTLAALWTQVLGVEQVGIYDNFFELGGHSLLAMQLMSRVRQTFGRSLPLATLLQAPTIADLAADLAGSHDRSPQILIPMQARGTQLPLFCLHPAGGHILVYQSLAAGLAPDQPLYGLQSRALTDVTQEYSTLDDMATDYAAAIRVQQPAGPYYLLGWSMGGVLAMSVAQVLEHQGQCVAFVGLLDAYLPTSDHRPWEQDPLRGVVFAFGGTMANALATLHPVAQHALRSELLGLPPLARLQRLISWGREHHLLPAGLPLEILQQQVALTEAHIALLQTHRMTTIHAPLYIWWARHGLQEGLVRPAWGAYTLGPVRIENAAGNHFSMMQTPHVQILTAQLQTGLRAVQGTLTH